MEPETIADALAQAQEDKKKLADKLITLYDLDPSIFYIDTDNQTINNMTKMSTWIDKLIPEENVIVITNDSVVDITQNLPKSNKTKTWCINNTYNDVIIQFDASTTFIDMDEIISNAGTINKITVTKGVYAEISVLCINIEGTVTYIFSSKFKE